MTKGASFAEWLNKKTNSQLNNNKNNPSNSQHNVYNKKSGVGVLARFLPDGEADPNGQGGGAATFLHKDIITPNQVYSLLDDDTYPSSTTSQLLAIAQSPDHLGRNFGNARKDSSWGWGVFYPHDSNALDIRATPYWDNKKDMINETPPTGYKAPAAWNDYNTGKWSKDVLNSDGSKQRGSGNDWLKIGNPYAHQSENARYGLGAGIHVDRGYNDSVNECKNFMNFDWPHLSGFDQNWRNDTLTGYFGEVNYSLKTGDTWGDFVDELTEAVTKYWGVKIGETHPDGYLIKQGYLDAATPWVNNPKDLINLQNSLYLNRSKYMTKKDGSKSNYWGWNEIPSSNTYWNEKDNIRGSIVHLPLGFKAKNFSDANRWKNVKKDIQKQIDAYANYYSADGVPFDLTYLINNKPIAFAQTLPKSYDDELYEMSYVSNGSPLKTKHFQITDNGILEIF